MGSQKFRSVADFNALAGTGMILQKSFNPESSVIAGQLDFDINWNWWCWLTVCVHWLHITWPHPRLIGKLDGWWRMCAELLLHEVALQKTTSISLKVAQGTDYWLVSTIGPHDISYRPTHIRRVSSCNWVTHWCFYTCKNDVFWHHCHFSLFTTACHAHVCCNWWYLATIFL